MKKLFLGERNYRRVTVAHGRNRLLQEDAGREISFVELTSAELDLRLFGLA